MDCVKGDEVFVVVSAVVNGDNGCFDVSQIANGDNGIVHKKCISIFEKSPLALIDARMV